MDDPFKHHPDLREKIVEPLGSAYRALDLSALDEVMRAAGAPPDWRRSDDEREALRRDMLSARLGADLWVFAYGSLMWDPGFRFAEVRAAQLAGYHRSFCLRSEIGRGSKDLPGLMAALDVGGACHGLAFRVARDLIEEETRVIWRREMISHAYAPAFLPVETAHGRVEALAFVIDPAARNYCPDLSEAATARLVATGAGFYGSNLSYVESLVEHFEVLGVHDEALLRLRDRAREIAAEHTEQG